MDRRTGVVVMLNAKYVVLCLLVVLRLVLLWTEQASSEIPPSFRGKGNAHPKVQGVLSILEVEEMMNGPFHSDILARERRITTDMQGRVTVFLITEMDDFAPEIDMDVLASHGAQVMARERNVIKANVPISRIREIAETLKGVSFIKLPDRAYPEAVTSKGAGLTGADAYHAAGYSGEGIKVGIVDVGFAGVSVAIEAGELPHNLFLFDCRGSRCVSQDPFSDIFELERHGTAVAEIVSDMAPGAELYLLKINDSLDLVNAKNFCIAQGIRVVNHSATYRNVNFLGGDCHNSNPVCTVDDAHAGNIVWVNAAGNYALNHYAASFGDSDNNGWHNVSERSECVEFFGLAHMLADLYITWNAWPTTDQDYDLYLFDSMGKLVASSVDVQSGSQPPTEFISVVLPYTDTYCVKVQNYSASGNHDFKLFAPGVDLVPAVAAGSLGTPADARGSLSVGAMEALDWITGPIADYSSQGPTYDGRMKPEVVGPSSVSTLSLGIDGFSGTSASAPHVAGAAALMLSLHPEYTASQVMSTFPRLAVDMGLAGPDNIFGYGRLNIPPFITVPRSQQSIVYNPVATSVDAMVSEQAKPVSVGAVAQNGNTLALHVSLFTFSEAVDIYLGIYAPGVTSDIFVVHPDGVPRPASLGIVPWRANTLGPVDEFPYGEIPVDLFTKGRYYLYLVVTPAGRADTFYLWQTFFDVP